jgi:hypothetical protein
VLGFTPTLGQSRGATRNVPQRIVIESVYMVANIDEPITLIEVLQGKNRMQWEQAMIEKYQSLM